LDENKEICNTPNTGLWFDKKYYPADTDNAGKILIPYGTLLLTSQALLVHNGFTQVEEFTRLLQDYTLDVIYFVHNESLLMGNEAKVLIRPILKINGRKCSLKILK
jgi:hypothetical protein